MGSWCDSWLLVASKGGRPVGFAWVRPLSNHRAYIEEVAVLPALQGLGIGTALLREVVTRLHLQGCEEVTILPISQRKAWVERAGFLATAGGTYRMRSSALG